MADDAGGDGDDDDDGAMPIDADMHVPNEPGARDEDVLGDDEPVAAGAGEAVPATDADADFDHYVRSSDRQRLARRASRGARLSWRIGSLEGRRGFSKQRTLQLEARRLRKLRRRMSELIMRTCTHRDWRSGAFGV